MKSLLLSSLIYIFLLKLSFVFEKDLGIMDIRLPVSPTCNESVWDDAIQCMRDANDKYNVTPGIDEEINPRNACYANWETMCCITELVVINCTIDDQKSLEESFNEHQNILEKEICKQYPRRDISCTEYEVTTSSFTDYSSFTTVLSTISETETTTLKTETEEESKKFEDIILLVIAIGVIIIVFLLLCIAITLVRIKIRTRNGNKYAKSVILK